MLFNKVNELLVLNSACPYNHNILTKVTSFVEVDNHVSIDLSDVVNITKDWLAHHMLSVAVKVNILH